MVTSSSVAVSQEEDIHEQTDLCQSCKRVLESIDQTARRGEHSSTSSTRDLLQTSAERGCPLCLLFWNSLSQPKQELMCSHFKDCISDPAAFGKFKTTYILGHLDDRLQRSFSLFLSNELKGGSNEDKKVWIELNFSPKTHELSALEGNTGSMTTQENISRWLKNCIKDHPRCNTRSTPFKPSRLIEINHDEDGTYHIHLITKSQMPSLISYIALSHCWGPSPVVKLLKDNLSSRLDSICFNELPKTFQDAIIVTQRLGIKHIWIDSLCIIQDSPEDWELESARMGQVYANCMCNIAATAASDGSVGLFFDRDNRYVSPVEVEVGYTADGTARRYLVTNETICYGELTTYGEVWGLNTAPLTSRAWVCQERLSSSRTLHFGLNQVFWECREQSACETFPEGDPNEPWMLTAKRPLSDLAELQPDGYDKVVEHFDAWRNILEFYTCASLTFESDRLVAISGLAAEIQNVVRVEYFAGIWNREIPLQLLWKTFPNGWGHRHDGYIGPTWSWASVTGGCEVEPYHHGYEYEIEVLDIRVMPLGTNLLGQVKEGYLRVRGRLFEAHVGESPGNEENHNPYLQINGTLTNDQSFRASDDKIEIFSDVFLANDGSEISDLKLFLMPILEIENNMELGLVLQKASTKDNNGMFSRWGWFRALEPRVASTATKYCKLFDEHLSNKTGIQSVLDRNGVTRYEITIV